MISIAGDLDARIMMIRTRNFLTDCCLMLTGGISWRNHPTTCVIFSTAWASMTKKSSASPAPTLLAAVMKTAVGTGKSSLQPRNRSVSLLKDNVCRGPWTYAPTTFSNEYFRLLLEERWSKKKTHQGKEWNGPEQYETANGELMMLPTDMALIWDDKMRPYVELYAKDEELFFKDFKKAWMKLQELGVGKFNGWRRYIFFGPRE